MVSLRGMLRAVALTGALVGMSLAPAGVMAGADLPTLEKGKGDRCVEDTQFMRRNHMELLKHQRDKTMREGIRTTQHSLKKCVECHASEKTGSVAASKDDFCASCHRYAAVKLDCWDCHATKPAKPKAAPVAAVAPTVPPMTTSAQPGGLPQ